MASQPTTEDGEESLEELDLDEAAVISHQSEVHAPARRQQVQVDQPSIVVAAEPEPQLGERRQVTQPRARRALEPTLLIRDRRAADDLRREMDLRIKAIKREQLRSTVLWFVLGILAFGLGGLIALLVARSRAGSSGAADRQPQVEASDDSASRKAGPESTDADEAE